MPRTSKVPPLPPEALPPEEVIPTPEAPKYEELPPSEAPVALDPPNNVR